MLKKIFRSGKTVHFYQTFTYFIPAPKQKSASYRELQFDNLITQHLKEHKLELVSVSSQSIVSDQTEGIWVIAVCRGENPPKISKQQNPQPDQSIEGFYHISESNN